jgi:hypothetical protein
MKTVLARELTRLDGVPRSIPSVQAFVLGALSAVIAFHGTAGDQKQKAFSVRFSRLESSDRSLSRPSKPRGSDEESAGRTSLDINSIGRT